jgi:hypothetical protein
MPTIRTFAPNDSLIELTQLLHRAYANLGALGLNYTAVDQTPEDTAKQGTALALHRLIGQNQEIVVNRY